MVRKTPAKQNQAWDPKDVEKMKKLLKSNTPTPLIAYELDRSPSAVQKKANDLGLTTKPVNKSPYNKKK